MVVRKTCVLQGEEGEEVSVVLPVGQAEGGVGVTMVNQVPLPPLDKGPVRVGEEAGGGGEAEEVLKL